jgi:hypothetical protein
MRSSVRVFCRALLPFTPYLIGLWLPWGPADVPGPKSAQEAA